jgi:serine/threonine protein kinase
MIDTILNERYQLKKLLREKAGRKTFLALDLKTEKLVIVKLLVFNNQFVWDDLKLFEREAQTLKFLCHSAIPQYLDGFEFDLTDFKGFALVQTHIDAPSLQESFVQGRRFNEEEVKEIARKLLDILIYLHEHNPPVIHRDIKPSNILLTNRSGNSVGDIYLVDFGSVQNVLANDDGTITIVGTYGYMPMEQFSGQTIPASDLYSLGATLIYLVTGKHPSELLKKQVRITFEDQVNLSESFIDWLKMMTEPALDLRFTSARKAIASLNNPNPMVAIKGENTLTKPLDSKVRMINNKHKLEITIPPPRWGFKLTLIMPILSFIPLAFILLNIFANFLNILPLMLAIFTLYLLVIILFHNRKTRLLITQDKITITQELKGFRYLSLNAFPEQITAIEHTLLAYREGSKGSTITILPKINFCIGTIKKVTFVSENRLSSPELHWLAQEISHWLGVPIIRN